LSIGGFITDAWHHAILIREFREEIGVHKFTLIKWDGNKQIPRYKTEKLKLMKAVPGVGWFLAAGKEGLWK
jgi:hypothetical protein